MEDVTIRFLEFCNFIISQGSVKNVKEVAKELGISASMMTEISKGRSNIGTKPIQNAVSKFDLNSNWLFTGTGDMIVGQLTPKADIIRSTIPIPIVDINVAAGSGEFNNDYLEIDNSILLPDRLVKGCEQYLCVKIKGDSMAPTLQDSSYLIIGQLNPAQWVNMPDKHIYVIIDKEGKSFVKRLKNRLKQGFVVCTSDNVDKSQYPNFNIDIDDIHGIWHAEWYFTAKMENINENYYSRLEQLEDKIDNIEALLGNQTLLEYKNKK